MDPNKPNHYKESGIAPLLNIALCIVCSLAVILFISYFYSLITTYLPVIYFNVLIVIAYGFTISYVSRLFNVLFKIRNRKKTILITVILSVLGVYFQWVSYLFILSYEDQGPFSVFSNLGNFFMLLLRPDLVVQNCIEISKIGLWTIGNSSIHIRGLVLWLVWLSETGIILFVSIYNYINFSTIPFSEKDNKWFKKEFIDFDFEHITYKKAFIEDFYLNPFKAISNLKRGDGLRHSKIAVFKSETETKNLISIDNIVVTQRGKGKKDYTKVLEHYYLDSNFLTQLKQQYKTKKASIFDY